MNSSVSSLDSPKYEYQVAFSYAGENRPYVEATAETLKAMGVTVFYDRFESARLWGKDLYDELRAIYQEKAQFCVLFLSEHYARKNWTSHERQSAQARAIESSAEYILPVRFDDTKIPGLNTNLAYLNLSNITPQQLAGLIVRKLEQAGAFGNQSLRTVKELAVNLSALQSQLETVNSDPDFRPDDPLRHKACPKCAEPALRRIWHGGGRHGDMQVAEVRCPSCDWNESHFTTPDIGMARRKYPDIESNF